MSERDNDFEIVDLGKVAVDSGKLLITDPSYIESEWKKTKVDFKEYYFDMETEDIIESPKMNLDKGITFESIYRDNMTYNEAIENGILKLKDEYMYPTKEFSSDGCFKNTFRSLGGSLNFKLGHEGVGVVFRSGFGDGTYDVFAIVKDFGQFGKRITRVIIDLIPEEDNEENNIMTRMMCYNIQNKIKNIKSRIKKKTE